MRSTLFILLSIILLGCTAQDRNNTPLRDSSGRVKEQLRVPISKDWALVHRDVVSGVLISEYVPEGQTAHDWTEMLTVLTIGPKSFSSLKEMFERMGKQLATGCAVPPIVGEPEYSSQGGFPIGIQGALCGETKKSGRGEALIYKAIQGKDAYYQVQHAWRLPAVSDSGDLAVTMEMRNAALDHLRASGLCNDSSPELHC